MLQCYAVWTKWKNIYLKIPFCFHFCVEALLVCLSMYLFFLQCAKHFLVMWPEMRDFLNLIIVFWDQSCIYKAGKKKNSFPYFFKIVTAFTVGEGIDSVQMNFRKLQNYHLVHTGTQNLNCSSKHMKTVRLQNSAGDFVCPLRNTSYSASYFDLK